MKWINVKDKSPPLYEELMVVKHYIDQEFCFETGGYAGPYFDTEKFVEFDKQLHENSWEKGGIVTYWMEKPKLPKDEK